MKLQEFLKSAVSVSNHLAAPKSPGVYVIRNYVNGKIYIGASKNLSNRIYGHKSSVSRGRHSCESLQSDWVAHGSDAFVFSIVQTNNLETAFELEKELISESFGEGCYNKVDLFGIGWQENPLINIALADIAAGMTAYAAAKKHGVQQSSISRALKRLANVCPCCGQTVKSPSSHLPMA